MTVKKKRTEQTPTIPIQMGMESMMERRKRTEQTQIILIQTVMGLMMERMITQQTPKTKIQMRMVFLTKKKTKMVLTPITPTPMVMESTMGRTISPIIQTRTLTQTMMVKEIIQIPTMTGMAFLMKKRRKMEPIPKIQIPMETE